MHCDVSKFKSIMVNYSKDVPRNTLQNKLKKPTLLTIVCVCVRERERERLTLCGKAKSKHIFADSLKITLEGCKIFVLF